MKKIKFISNLLVLLVVLMPCVSVGHTQKEENPADKMAWFKEAKFGMFIHWGLYTKAEGYWKGKKVKSGAHFMIHEKIKLKDYATLADDFNPVDFDADEWVLLAKNAGMKYLVITTKHHEGFAMYDSPSSDYNIVKRTPYGKDPMKALAKACKKHGIKLCFYYSLGRDWEDPDAPTNKPTKGGRSNLADFPDEDAKVFNRYFKRKVIPQITELLTQYGPVAVMWFDTPEGISRNESKELKELINTLQPECIINSRIGNGFGDFMVKEQKINDDINRKPWESCITISGYWSYLRDDIAFKSPELLVHNLLNIVSKGGNFLLNVGPTAEGIIPDESATRLITVGDWMKLNGEGIRGTEPWDIAYEALEPETKIEKNANTNGENNKLIDVANDATSKEIIPEIRFTSKGKDLYAYVCSYHEKEVIISSLALGKTSEIKEVTALGKKAKIKWSQTNDGLKIKMLDYPIPEVPVLAFKIKF